ncbi:MAG: hypothetical protein RML94_00125 [Bacteroidia bacterium]|nr:hypothetical protein [Bacteroidia bacterium]
MKEVIKSFSKGMNADSFKQNEAADEYSYAENIRLIGENAQAISLENVKGTIETALIQVCITHAKPYQSNSNGVRQTIELDGNEFKAIGYCTVSDFAIILVSNGKIGDIIIHKPSKVLDNGHALYSVVPTIGYLSDEQNAFKIALGYDIEYHDTYAEIRSDGKIYYYIAGRNNKKSRAILLSPNCPMCQKEALENDDNTIHFDYFIDNQYTPSNFDGLTSFVPYAKDPIIHLKGYNHPSIYYLAGIENTGNLEAGNWKYTIRYIDAFGNKTNWSPISQEIPVYEEPLFEDRAFNWNVIYGSAANTKCPKTVVLEIQNVDTNFSEIELAGILNQNGVESAYIIKKEFITGNTVIIKHTGSETYIPIDIADIAIRKVNVFNFETLKSIDNYLFIAGIKESLLKNFLPLQQLADKISLEWKTYSIEESEGTFSDFAGDANAGLPDCRPKIGNYKIPYHCYYRLGYFRDEDYCFGIQYKFKDGSYSPVFPIGKADYYKQIQNLVYDPRTGFDNSTDYGGELDGLWGQEVRPEPVLLQEVAYSDYEIDIDFCAKNKNFSYYKEKAYIYRSPAHIPGYEIIDGSPLVNPPIDPPIGKFNWGRRKAQTEMGRPRKVRVLYPEFYNIELPASLGIEGYYILRCERGDWGRIKQTGIATVSTLDANGNNASTSSPTRFRDFPPTPMFLNYKTNWYSNGEKNYYKAAGQLSNQWCPVFGFWSFDEIFAKDFYEVAEGDIMEFIYVNLPIHAKHNVASAHGIPSVDSFGDPITEENLLVEHHCHSLSPHVIGDIVGHKEWFKCLFLNLWVANSNSDVYVGNGAYKNLVTETVAHAEVNLWQRIQNKEWERSHKDICSVVNHANNFSARYSFDSSFCNPDWVSFYGVSPPIISVDLVNATPMLKTECDPSNIVYKFVHIHPCKLIQVVGYPAHIFGVQFGVTNAGGSLLKSNIALGGYGLLYYTQIRKLENRYPAPIYRPYVYASLFQPVENNPNVQINTFTYNQDTITVHNQLSVFGGDCYIGKYFIQIQKRDRSPVEETLANQGDGIGQSARYRTLHLSCYVESKHNIHLRNVMKNENDGVLQFGDFPYFNRGDIDVVRENANIFATEGTEYNLGYTTNKYTFAQAIKDFTNEENTTKYQIRYSLKHLDILKEDQYRVFLPNNFKDATRRYGYIYKLEELNGDLVLGQEDGIGFYKVSQAAQVPTTAGEIKLATYGVLSDKAEYLMKENEIGVQDLFGMCNTGNSLYVFDKKRKQILNLSNKGLEQLSVSKKISSLLKQLTYEQKKQEMPVFISNDRYFDEVLFKIKHDKNYKPIDVPFYEQPIPDILVYSEKLGAFVSFYTFLPDVSYSVNDEYYSWGKDYVTHQLVLHKHNHGKRGRFFNQTKNAIIKHNVAGDTGSTFDSIKIYGNSEYLDKQYRMFQDRIEAYPVRMYARTSYQYAKKEFVNNFNVRDIMFAHTQNVPIDNILYKEQTWHTDFPFAIPENNPYIIEIEKNLIPEFYSNEKLRDYFCEILWELNNGEHYPENSLDFIKYSDKRYRWLFIKYWLNPSYI